MKLIKLSETHYIVVDDSEIKESDFALNVKIKRLNQARFMFDSTDCKKITHSTQPLEFHEYNNCYFFNDIKKISLLEVEEVIYGYSVEKMAEKEFPLLDESWCRTGATHEENLQLLGHRRTYIKGFNACKELVKDKLFTIEDIFNYSQMICEKLPELKKLQTSQADDYGNNLDVILKIQDEFIQSLLRKTEWEVEFDEQGKLKLI